LVHKFGGLQVSQRHRDAQKTVYVLTQTIKNEESGQIIVDIVAPSTPSVYSPEWALISGNTIQYILNVTVTVKLK
jgi:hypothetical protein